MKLYKLTNEKNQTYKGCQWGENVTYKTDGKGELCGSGWIYAYIDPLLAVVLNPIHGNFNLRNAHLWECIGEIEKEDNGLKIGCVKLTTRKQIKLPKITLEQKTRFAIYCALEIYKNNDFKIWADNWLNNKNRTAEAAGAAIWAVGAAPWAAKAAVWAAWAARTAAWAAEAAAEAAWAAEAARAAVWAAGAAAWAAEAAPWAANKKINLLLLLQKAIKDENKLCRKFNQMNWQKELQRMVNKMRYHVVALQMSSAYEAGHRSGYSDAICFVADEIQKMFAKAEEEREC